MRLSRSELPLAAKVVTIFYAVLAAFHLLLLNDIVMWVMFFSASFASLTCLAIWLYNNKVGKLSYSEVWFVQLGFTLVTTENALIHLFITGDIKQTLNLIILFIFLVYLRLPLKMFYATLVGTSIAWLLIVTSHPVDQQLLIHYSFGIAMTCAIAITIYSTNRQLTRRGIAGFRKRLLLEQQLKLANEQLSTLAMRDPLTDIANRRLLIDFFDKLCKRASQSGTTITLAVCDIDHFKRFNDTWGHQSGDAALVALASLLNENTRGLKDLAGRIGGDEFALILGDTDKARAELVARRIYGQLPLPLEQGTKLIISMGLFSFVPKPGCTFNEAFAMADKALYQAKTKGRGNYRCIEG